MEACWLDGSDPFSNASSGLFLAAPRKSTFLQQDLQPALEAAGAVTVYVDLWADRNRDPALLIRSQLAKALATPDGATLTSATANRRQQRARGTVRASCRR